MPEQPAMTREEWVAELCTCGHPRSDHYDTCLFCIQEPDCPCEEFCETSQS